MYKQIPKGDYIMNKKLIAIAVLLLAVVVVFAACKKDEDYKVDFTVELDNGEIIEVYEDEDGENFVTNVDGDEIPVTTDVDGFYDDIENLITETTTKKADKTEDKSSTTSTTKPDTSKDEPSSSEEKEEPSSSEEKDEPTSSNKEEPSSESNGVEIGDDKNKGTVIDWNDIVAAP